MAHRTDWRTDPLIGGQCRAGLAVDKRLLGDNDNNSTIEHSYSDFKLPPVLVDSTCNHVNGHVMALSSHPTHWVLSWPEIELFSPDNGLQNAFQVEPWSHIIVISWWFTVLNTYRDSSVVRLNTICFYYVVTDQLVTSIRSIGCLLAPDYITWD